MKNILKFIFFTCILLKPWISFAADSGKVILNLDSDEKASVEKVSEDQLSAPRQLEMFLERYQYFNEKFPGDAIDGDIYEEVAKQYPYLGYNEIDAKTKDIRSAIKTYRYLLGLYDEVKEKMLAPAPPPLVVEEGEYDNLYRGEYVDSPSLVVINDFKKVISYGMDKRDFDAVEAKIKRDMEERRDNMKGFYQLGELMGKLEFKKLFFYGIAYDDPFSGRDGIGDWNGADLGRVRLIAVDTDLHQKVIKAALHFNLNPNQMLLWSPEKAIAEPSFNFSTSKNLEKAEITMPIPLRVIEKSNDNIMGYPRSFAIPVTLTVKDINQPLELKAGIKATVCGNNICTLQEFKPELDLLPGNNMLPSAVSTFINKVYATLPQPEIDNLKIEKLVVDPSYDDKNNQTLRVVMKTSEKPGNIKIFLKNFDDLSLSRPKITINGKKIIARFESTNPNTNLVGKKFEVTAAIDNMTSLRQELTARAASIFDIDRQELSLGLILLAFIGGFILNFMPCVFPVLSLKFLALTKFGAQKIENIRKSFAFTVLGVFIAFAFLCILLLILKYVGISIGWGMQFQNPYFIIGIMFVMVLFMAQIFELINIQSPQWLTKKLSLQTDSDSFLNILTGMFLVLVATPCTAPYLGTTLGFALAGSYLDIIVILTSVALGLSLPYILLAISPSLGFLMPKPGVWMQKLNKTMVLMLFLTVLWLGSVLYAQTSMSTALKIALYLILFLIVLYLRRRILDVVELQKESKNVRSKAASMVKYVSLFLALLLLGTSFYTAKRAFVAHQAEISLKRKLKLDRDQIAKYLNDGHTVIVKVGADWCLTCKFNDVTVFNNVSVASTLNYYNVKLIEVDWTNYDKDVLEFMKNFGRSGLPFYIIFSRSVPDGMVLPEILNEEDLVRVIKSFV